MQDKTRNRIIWLIIFLGFFVFVANANESQDVERLYWQWYKNGGKEIEAARDKRRQEELARFREEERIAKIHETLGANQRINQLTIILYNAVVLHEEILAKPTISEEDIRHLKILEDSTQTIGKELEKLAKQIRSNTK